jgi:hypothetical protein
LELRETADQEQPGRCDTADQQLWLEDQKREKETAAYQQLQLWAEDQKQLPEAADKQLWRKNQVSHPYLCIISIKSITQAILKHRK